MRWLADRTIEHLRDLPDLPSATDRYEFREEIGRGGMGAVYRAFDRELEREVAIKVVGGGAAGVAARLIQEARILGRLEHPGILPIHDAGTLPDGRAFHVMKLVRGERLDQALARPASLAERLRIFDRLCDAVAFAHAQGVVHRDLKPENIMIGAFGEVLVLDFGVAKITAAEPDGMVLGTPGYMAPEQAAGESARVDARADVYALGGILAALSDGGAGGRPRPLAAIVARAREQEPAHRYTSVASLAREVRRFSAGMAVEAYRESLVERIGRVVNRYRTPILLVGAYLLMRIILLLVP